MTDQQMVEQPTPDPTNKSELVKRIHRSRSTLEETIHPLSEAQLTRPGPDGGWSIKDHLAHLAIWELGVAELLRGHPRFQAMGVEQIVSQGKGFDEINDVIYKLHSGLPLSKVMDKFQSAHRQLLEALDLLEDEDLFKPYASFVPDGSETRLEPVIRWIIGNTYDHFDEHRGYIRVLIRKT